MTESLKYHERLLKSSQEKEEEEVKSRVEEAEIALRSDILATQKALSEAKRKIERLKNSSDFEPSRIIGATLEAEELQAGLDRLEQLQKEMF
jgi:hypothetical protein